MDAYFAYTLASAGWMGIQALALIATPKIVITLLANDYHITTDIETYFARSLGLALSTIILILLLISPSSSTSTPDANPLVPLTTLFHAASLIHAYTRWLHTAQLGYVVGAAGYGCLAAMGLWLVVFGGVKARLSKRTGADKRTAGWPFQNSKAYDGRKEKRGL